MAYEISASLTTETYGGSVTAAYMLGDVFGNTGMKYHGMKPGEIINEPLMSTALDGNGVGGAVGKADGTSHKTLATASLIGNEIPLWDVPVKAGNTIKTSDQNVRPDLKLVAEYGKQHGRELAKGKSIRLINFLADAAVTAANTKTKDWTTASTGAELVREGIEEIATAFDTAGVPVGLRRGILLPGAFYRLGQLEKVQSRDYGGQANTQTLGGQQSFIPYLNFDIVNFGAAFGTNYTHANYDVLALPVEEDLTNIYGIFWAEDSWGLREIETPHSTVEWLPDDQVWMPLARWHAGAKVIQSAGLYVLKRA